LGVPYTDAQISAAPAALKGKTEEDALIAYLQGLGTGVRKATQAQSLKAGGQ
jgi:cytochrome c oxidase cbb3-type subunit 2